MSEFREDLADLHVCQAIESGSFQATSGGTAQYVAIPTRKEAAEQPDVVIGLQRTAEQVGVPAGVEKSEVYDQDALWEVWVWVWRKSPL